MSIIGSEERPTPRRTSNAVQGVLVFMGMALIVCAGVMDNSLQVNELIQKSAAFKTEMLPQVAMGSGKIRWDFEAKKTAREKHEEARQKLRQAVGYDPGPLFSKRSVEVEKRDFPTQDSIPGLTIKSNSALPASALDLQEELRTQTEFQDLIYQNQFGAGNCHNRRILLSSDRGAMDGFTWELQDLGRMLEIGLATDRTFLVKRSFPSGYAPSSCRNFTSRNITEGGSWTCIFNPITNCTEENSGALEAKNKSEVLSSHFTASHGITHSNGTKVSKHSRYFNKYYYGQDRVVQGPKKMWKKDYQLHDVVPVWERRMGRYWIRSQISHYFWDTIGVADYLRKEMEPRLPKGLLLDDTPFIAMHIRYSDNINTLTKNFGRDAHTTRDLHHFLKIAEEIRGYTNISNIYLATDSEEVVGKLREISSDSNWTFWIQDSVPRAEKPDWLWFIGLRERLAPTIATDVEMLRRADYLIGSYQSNVYRLCTQLNSAFHAGRYSFHQNRHFSVDVEWYEDP